MGWGQGEIIVPLSKGEYYDDSRGSTLNERGLMIERASVVLRLVASYKAPLLFWKDD